MATQQWTIFPWATVTITWQHHCEHVRLWPPTIDQLQSQLLPYKRGVNPLYMCYIASFPACMTCCTASNRKLGGVVQVTARYHIWRKVRLGLRTRLGVISELPVLQCIVTILNLLLHHPYQNCTMIPSLWQQRNGDDSSCVVDPYIEHYFISMDTAVSIQWTGLWDWTMGLDSEKVVLIISGNWHDRKYTAPTYCF